MDCDIILEQRAIVSQTSDDKARRALTLTLTAVTGLVGCITIVITIAAMLLGLWLDARFETRPTITLVLTLGSLPVTLVVMFYAVRWTTTRMLISPEKDLNKEKVEEELG